MLTLKSVHFGLKFAKIGSAPTHLNPMKKIFSISIYFFSTILFGQQTSEERIKAVENGLAPIVRFDDEPAWNIEDRMARYNVPGVTIAVIKDYKLDWAKAYGVSNEETGEVNTTETAFQAASISKTINAIGVLKWAAENDIDLNADINSLLKSWQFSYENKEEIISLHHLLTHTAGLSVHGFPGYKNDKKLPTTTQILEGGKPANNPRVKRLFAPGEKFKYSGGGTTITQLIMEDNVGDYATYMNENLFTPLDMNRSFYPTSFKGNVSMSHNHKGDMRKNGYNTYPELGAAALWITPTDLAKLLIELQETLRGNGGTILSKETLQDMLIPANEGINNARGTFIHDEGNGKYFQHSGGNEGFNCQYYASMEDGHGAIVMINAEKFELINEILRSIANTYDWGVFKSQVIARKDTPDLKTLEDLTGTYRSVDFPDRTLEVSLSKEKLYVEEKKRWKSELIPQDENTFITKDINPAVNIGFEPGKMIIEQGGKYEWVKE